MGYYDVMKRRAELAGERLSVCVKPGMVAWEEVEMSSVLLASEVSLPPDARVLLLQCGTGALAVWAARSGADVHCYDSSLVAARLTEATLAANEVRAVVHEAAFPGEGEDSSFDVVLLPLPKGRAFTGLLLRAAYRALKPDGRLYFAGPNAGGAKAIVKDAGEIFGQAVTIHSKARHRVALATKGDTSPADGGSAGFAPVEKYRVDDLALYGMPGVFSWDGLDDGTARLLATIDANLCAEKRVLDVGCGCGVIGMQAARLGAAAVDMVDAGWLAVQSAEAGVAANGLADRCHAQASDLYAALPDAAYDLILSNPPFHIGHQVDTEAAEALISGARDRLEKGGRLRLVANLFLPYPRLMQEVFGKRNVRTIHEDTRYRVVDARVR